MSKSPQPDVDERVNMFRYRASEEFYDLKKDPSCLRNLVDHPAYKKKVEEYRKRLALWMTQHGDPVAEVFQQRDNPVEMRRKLDDVYANVLRSGSRRYEEYRKKVVAMKKHNFE